jgi:ribosome maturation protein SDO1
MKTPTANFVKEPVKLNLARLKKGGEIFEVVVEPSKIVDLKEGKISDVKQAVDSMKIFADAKRGLVASEEKMLAIFGTQDAVKIIEQILKTGEIQLTQEYREKVRSEKRLKIINIIVRMQSIQGQISLIRELG